MSKTSVPVQESATEYNSLVFKFLDRFPFPFTLTRLNDILIPPCLELSLYDKHLRVIKDMEDTSDREILISSQYNSMMSLVIFRIAYDTCLIKLEIIQRLIHWLYPIIPLTHCSLYLIIYICGVVVTHNVLSDFQPKGKGVREDAFFHSRPPYHDKKIYLEQM